MKNHQRYSPYSYWFNVRVQNRWWVQFSWTFLVFQKGSKPRVKLCLWLSHVKKKISPFRFQKNDSVQHRSLIQETEEQWEWSISSNHRDHCPCIYCRITCGLDMTCKYQGSEKAGDGSQQLNMSLDTDHKYVCKLGQFQFLVNTRHPYSMSDSILELPLHDWWLLNAFHVLIYSCYPKDEW